MSVTDDTLFSVVEDAVRWLVLVVRVPAEPTRHRVAVWRELRRAGAVLLGQGVWVVPDVPVFADGIARTVALAERGDGEVTVLIASGRDRARRRPAGGAVHRGARRGVGRVHRRLRQIRRRDR